MDNVEFGLEDVFDLSEETSEAASPEGGSPGEAAEPTEFITETVSEVSFLDKPFNEYSTTESLFLLFLALVVLICVQNIFRRD